jgi:hypothetical protein
MGAAVAGTTFRPALSYTTRRECAESWTWSLRCLIQHELAAARGACASRRPYRDRATSSLWPQGQSCRRRHSSPFDKPGAADSKRRRSVLSLWRSSAGADGAPIVESSAAMLGCCSSSGSAVSTGRARAGSGLHSRRPAPRPGGSPHECSLLSSGHRRCARRRLIRSGVRRQAGCWSCRRWRAGDVPVLLADREAQLRVAVAHDDPAPGALGCCS